MPYFNEFVETLEQSHPLFSTYPILAEVIAEDLVRRAMKLEGYNRNEEPTKRQQEYAAKDFAHVRAVAKALGYQVTFQSRGNIFPIVLRLPDRKEAIVPLSVGHERRL